MKQMISNHREIESLEDFIYYDKSSGKIVIKKPIVDGSGNPIPSYRKDTLGEMDMYSDGTSGFFDLELDSQVNYQLYDLFLFTAGGNTVIFLSSQLLNTEAGLKQVGNFIVLEDGTTNICKCRLSQFEGEEYFHMRVSFGASLDITANYKGYLFGIKL